MVTLFSLELLLNGVITVPDPMTFINCVVIIGFGVPRKYDKTKYKIWEMGNIFDTEINKRFASNLISGAG